MAELKIMSNEDCKENTNVEKELRFKLNGKQLCARETDKDSCQVSFIYFFLHKK